MFPDNFMFLIPKQFVVILILTQQNFLELFSYFLNLFNIAASTLILTKKSLNASSSTYLYQDVLNQYDCPLPNLLR